MTSQAYGNCNAYKSKQPSGCFITSAVCGSQGKPDNCYELTAFRAFRDDWLAAQDGGKDAIINYYSCAPAIVSAIDSLPNASAIWQSIYDGYIMPCITKMEASDYDGCYILYQNMVDRLSLQYGQTVLD
jgi:hypothetical protein